MFVLDVVDGVLTPDCDIVVTADDPEWCWSHEQTGGECLRPPTEWNGHVLTCHCDRHTSDGQRDMLCDCVDGHPIIEVPVPCGCECHTSSDPDVRADAYLCDECDQLNPGTRWVRVSVQAVPIVDTPETGYPHPKPDLFVRISRAETPALRLVDSLTKTDTYLGPSDDARPGQYAIIATPEGDDQ